MLQRERRYPARMTVSMSAETRAAIDAAVTRYGIAPGVLARWAIEAGLPVVRHRLRERLRKRKRKADRYGSGEE